MKLSSFFVGFTLLVFLPPRHLIAKTLQQDIEATGASLAPQLQKAQQLVDDMASLIGQKPVIINRC